MNIGNLIITFLESKNLPQAYLAKKLNMPTSNLSRLLKRESMDTDKLLDISIKLKHNFFADICGDEISANAVATPQALDMDFECKLLASQLVSEVRRSPDHLSLTLTGDGVLAFVKALQTFAIENSSSTPENGHLFPKMSDDLIAKKDVMEGLGVTHTTLWKWEKAGYLIPVRFGKKIYYKKDDLKKLGR